MGRLYSVCENNSQIGRPLIHCVRLPKATRKRAQTWMVSVILRLVTADGALTAANITNGAKVGIQCHVSFSFNFLQAYSHMWTVLREKAHIIATSLGAPMFSKAGVYMPAPYTAYCLLYTYFCPTLYTHSVLISSATLSISSLSIIVYIRLNSHFYSPYSFLFLFLSRSTFMSRCMIAAPAVQPRGR